MSLPKKDMHDLVAQAMAKRKEIEDNERKLNSQDYLLD